MSGFFHFAYSVLAFRAAPRAAVDCGRLRAFTGLPRRSAKMSAMAALFATPPENTMGGLYVIYAARPMEIMRRAMERPVPAAMSATGTFCDR